MKTLVIALIRVYQMTLATWLGGRCRFYPSCSNYAMEAIRSYGVLRGGMMSLWRILKCQPFHPGGYDPVPPPKSGAGEFGTFVRHNKQIRISRT